MAPPVWVLSVDLQTKTATFQSGMADAARSARGAFSSIGDSARRGGERAAEGMLNTRAALGILDNSIRGAHAQAMADLIRLFAQSSIVMAALPLAATAGAFMLVGGGAVALAHKIHELKQEQEQLGRTMTDFGTAAQNAFNSLDEKILQSEMRSDELRNNHLVALRHQLQLIDMQSMGQLEHTFDDLAKKVDVVFASLKSSWYTFGIGSDGAKHALEVFQSQYDSLLAKGNGSAASSLLKGTTDAAERYLAMQKDTNAQGGLFSFTEKEIQAQEKLIEVLHDQEAVEHRIKKENSKDKGNAKYSTAAGMSSEHSAAAKQAAASMLQMGQAALAADKAVADARLAVQRASIQARTQNDLDFANREYQMQLAANDQQIQALDKYSKDYANQLKALHEKALEITQQHDTAVATISSKARVEQNAKALADLEAGERQKIDATQQGSAARLAAIDAALKEERAKNMQDLAVYTALQTERVNVSRQMAFAEARAKADATDVRVRAIMNLAEAEAAAKAKMMQDAGHGEPMRLAQLAQAQNIADMEYQIKRAALAKELALYREAGEQRAKDAAKTAAKLDLLDKQHTLDSQENQRQENASFKSSCAQMEQAYAQSFLQIAERHGNLTQLMNRFVDQSVQATLQGLLAEANGQKSEQLAFAKTAAAKAWNAMAGIPIVGPELGAVAAATTFAGVMAFEKGGIVPGIGHVDSVPAMLTPGEGIIPRGVMDGLQTMVRNGNMNGGGNITHVVHVHQTNHINTIDGDGMKDVLDKHADQLQKHFNNHVRKLNK